jgi:hypothetical protein
MRKAWLNVAGGLWVAGAACTAPAYFPKEPPPFPDSGADPTEPTPSSSPPEGPPCSVDAGGVAYLEVVVVGSEARRLYWVDHGCNEIDYGELIPGGLLAQSTYVGHAWVARDAVGARVSWVVVDEDPERWEVP